MHFTASAAIIVLVCMASAIDATLPIAKMMSQRSMMGRPSSQTNININENDNQNSNFLFSSLISELLANIQDSDQDLCENDDDDSCIWKVIRANVLAKSTKAVKKTAADETAKPILEKAMGNAKSFLPRRSSNFNFNSNSNENSNFDFSSAFASLQQFLRNKKSKLTKEITVKKN